MSKQVETTARRFVDGVTERYGAVGALGRARIIRHEYKHNPQWMTRSIALLEQAAAREIVSKWIAKCGVGFHPDTRGADYSPALSPVEISQYEADMRLLFTLPLNPYVVAIEAMVQTITNQEGSQQ